VLKEIGFLEQLVNAGRALIGDAKIIWPNSGFPYYDELIAELQADDRVLAAAPMIETFGVINLPDDKVQGVQIQGIDPESFKTRKGKVGGYVEDLSESEIAELNDKLKRELNPVYGY